MQTTTYHCRFYSFGILVGFGALDGAACWRASQVSIVLAAALLRTSPLPLGRLLAVDISQQVVSLVEESSGREPASEKSAFFLKMELGHLSGAAFVGDLVT